MSPAITAAEAPALKQLAPREREVAAIVYNRTRATALEVQSGLSDRLSNAAVRSMLKRLVAKGILRVRKKKGQSQFIYSPAQLLPDVQARALEQTVTDFFEGSFGHASRVMLSLLQERDSAGLRDLRTYLQDPIDHKAFDEQGAARRAS